MTERSTATRDEAFNALLEAARVAEIKLRDGGVYPINGETWRALRDALLPYKGIASWTPPSAEAASSPLGALADVIAEYDRIVDGRLDPRDAEADFVMRGSDWRAIREALRNVGTSEQVPTERNTPLSAIGAWTPVSKDDREFSRVCEFVQTQSERTKAVYVLTDDGRMFKMDLPPLPRASDSDVRQK